jgi:hypothetical protein
MFWSSRNVAFERQLRVLAFLHNSVLIWQILTLRKQTVQGWECVDPFKTGEGAYSISTEYMLPNDEVGVTIEKAD